MNRFANLTAVALALALSLNLKAAEQQERSKPQELDVLNHYVGAWTTAVKNKPSAWNPKAEESRVDNQAEWMLDGRFIKHVEVHPPNPADPGKATKALMIWGYDAEARSYSFWQFHSTGLVGKWNGKWNAAAKTMTLTTKEGPPNTNAAIAITFPNKDTIEGNAIFKNDAGEMMFDMDWTRKRQPEATGKKTAAAWQKIDPPAAPIPPEMAVLKDLVGDWDAVSIIRLTHGDDPTTGSKGQWTIRPILDGRVLLGASDFGNKSQSMWLFTYDTNRKAFRKWEFQSSGHVFEATGRWDPGARSLIWKFEKIIGAPDTTRWRFIGKNVVKMHFGLEAPQDNAQHAIEIHLTRKEQQPDAEQHEAQHADAAYVS